MQPSFQAVFPRGAVSYFTVAEKKKLG